MTKRVLHVTFFVSLGEVFCSMVHFLRFSCRVQNCRSGISGFHLGFHVKEIPDSIAFVLQVVRHAIWVLG